MLGVGPQVALDRLRPDDSILSLVSVLGRLDDEIVPYALEDFADQPWPGYAVGDGAVAWVLPPPAM